MALGTVIAALIGAAGTFASAGLQMGATEEAREEAKRLAELQRKDVREAQMRAEALTKESMAFQKEEAALGRAERAEQRAYQRQVNAWKRAANLINGNQALKNNLVNIWGRR